MNYPAVEKWVIDRNIHNRPGADLFALFLAEWWISVLSASGGLKNVDNTQ
jgi:hypothetical protein